MMMLSAGVGKMRGLTELYIGPKEGTCRTGRGLSRTREEAGLTATSLRPSDLIGPGRSSIPPRSRAPAVEGRFPQSVTTVPKNCPTFFCATLTGATNRGTGKDTSGKRSRTGFMYSLPRVVVSAARRTLSCV